MITLKRGCFRSRLEPIVCLKKGKIVGYEMLSKCLTDNTHPEQLFNQLSADEHLELLSRQLEKYQKWTEQHPELYKGKKLYINLNDKLFEYPELTSYFLPFCRIYDVSIEIEKHYELKKHEISIIEKFKSMGIQVWLDDYNGYDLNKTIGLWDGIKIDKDYFWKQHKNQKCPLDKLNKTLSNIIIEGIEHLDHHQTAKHSGAQYGQGFLWRAVY